MPEQSTGRNRSTESSTLPVFALVLVIALWYAWGLGLVLLGAWG